MILVWSYLTGIHLSRHLAVSQSRCLLILNTALGLLIVQKRQVNIIVKATSLNLLVDLTHLQVVRRVIHVVEIAWLLHAHQFEQLVDEYQEHKGSAHRHDEDTRLSQPVLLEEVL